MCISRPQVSCLLRSPFSSRLSAELSQVRRSPRPLITMTRSQFLSLFTLLATLPLGVGQAQPLQIYTVYIQNPTSNSVTFSYKRGGDDWQKIVLKSGSTITLKGIGPHQISFTNGQKKKNNYSLKAGTYYFYRKNDVLDLADRSK